MIGVEGMGAWTDIKGSQPDLVFGGKNVLSSKTEALASITGRLGYSFDRVLFYGKGGGAWARDRYQNNNAGIAFFGIPPNVFTARTDRFGWTLGAGVEWAFADNWSAKVEYNHYDFGSKGVSLTDAVGPSPRQRHATDRHLTVWHHYRFWAPQSGSSRGIDRFSYLSRLRGRSARSAGWGLSPHQKFSSRGTPPPRPERASLVSTPASAGEGAHLPRRPSSLVPRHTLSASASRRKMRLPSPVRRNAR